ncbi:Multidrug resistance-associated protein 5, partial [Clarias magur]
MMLSTTACSRPVHSQHRDITEEADTGVRFDIDRRPSEAAPISAGTLRRRRFLGTRSFREHVDDDNQEDD